MTVSFLQKIWKVNFFYKKNPNLTKKKKKKSGSLEGKGWGCG